MAFDPSQSSTPKKYISAASVNAQVLVNKPCVLTFLSLGSLAAAAGSVVKLYDSATLPNVGTDVPVQIYVIPGNAPGSGSNLAPPGGLIFANGLSLAITGGLADTDTTPVAAGQISLSYATRS